MNSASSQNFPMRRYQRVGNIPMRPLPPAQFTSSQYGLLHRYPSGDSVSASDEAGPSTVGTPVTEFDDNPTHEAPVQNVDTNNAERSPPNTITTRLRPVLPPPNYTSLDWRPKTLQTGALVIMALVSYAIAGTTFAVLRGAGTDLQILLTSENVHIMSTYLPAIVATVTGLLFQTTYTDICRMMPYYAMADGKDSVTTGSRARDSVGGSFYPWPSMFILPKGGLTVVFNLLQISLNLMMFLTAAKVVLLQSKPVEHGWTLTVNPGAADYIITAYMVTGSMYLLLLYWVSHHQTGLKWDPASLQDQLTLFSETRAAGYFECLSSSTDQAYELMSPDARWRIGYWQKERLDPDGNRTESIVYGISPVRPSGKPTTVYETITPSTTPRAVLQPSCECRRYPRCQHGPRRYCVRSTWLSFIRQCFHLGFYLAGLGAVVIAFATGAFVNGFDMRDTWKDPKFHFTWWIIGRQAMTDTNLPYALVFRFVPTQIAFWTAGHINFLDVSIRASQPYVAMAAGETLGSNSIGLEYLTMLAFQIPIVAFEKGHYKVAWFTAVNAISSLCPIFVSGLFIISKQDGNVYFEISKISFFAVLFYCIIFSISIIWAWTREIDRLPRLLFSIADQMSLCRGTRILDEKRLDIAGPTTTREKYQAKMVLLENKYSLGFYKGTCGHEHFGFDVVETSTEALEMQEISCNLVTPVTRQPKSGTHAFGLSRRHRVRRQRLSTAEEEGEQV